jgi:transposase
MNNTRREHSAAFKTEVVLEAIKGQKTLSELAQKYELTPEQISSWKSEFLANAQSLFDPGQKQEDSLDKEKEDLYRQIAQLKMENEWLNKKLR